MGWEIAGRYLYTQERFYVLFPDNDGYSDEFVVDHYIFTL